MTISGSNKQGLETIMKRVLMIHPKFLECAASLPKHIKSKLVKVLWLLSENFAHPSLQCKKVKGSQVNVFECRVDQSIRLIYDEHQGVLRCWYVGEHDCALDFAQFKAGQMTHVFVDDIQIGPNAEDTSIASTIRFLISGKITDSFLKMDLEEACTTIEA
jgi:mRNA-degrading endonuclease RelE of RelBE toxin-antitoxin system